MGKLRTEESILIDQRILRERRMGKTLREIGAGLGISIVAVHNRLEAALKEIPVGDARALIQLQLEKLDKLWETNLVLALDGNPEASKICISILAHEAKLLGLNAANRVEITSETSEDKRRILTEMVALAKEKALAEPK